MPSSKRWPTQYEVAYTIGVIGKYIPLDSQFDILGRHSDRGIPNVRIQNATEGRSWMVDIYPDNFYCVFAPGVPPSICSDITHLIGYLSSQLKKKA